MFLLFSAVEIFIYCFCLPTKATPQIWEPPLCVRCNSDAVEDEEHKKHLQIDQCVCACEQLVKEQAKATQG